MLVTRKFITIHVQNSLKSAFIIAFLQRKYEVYDVHLQLHRDNFVIKWMLKFHKLEKKIKFYSHHGISPFSVALETDKVQTEFVYPSQLQLSWSLPPLPDAQTKMDPFPSLPWVMPWMNARVARRPGPSTVLPSSSGPQLEKLTVIFMLYIHVQWDINVNIFFLLVWFLIWDTLSKNPIQYKSVIYA